MKTILASNNHTLHIDECRYILLKIIEQAIHDYLTLEHTNQLVEIECYKDACDFLFNPAYIFLYGSEEMNLLDILEILDIDHLWFREKLIKLKEKRRQEQRAKMEKSVAAYSLDFDITSLFSTWDH